MKLRNVVLYGLVCLATVFFLIQPVFAEPLPDTGQTKCYNEVGEIPCPNPGEPYYGQDGNYLINPPSYTKLDANGNDLPDSATSWVMVRDNVTGLIWEVKTDDGSIRDRDDQYVWSDTQDVFVAQVNAEKLGGHSDWRLPTIQELSSIAALGQYDPAVNETYFPNTVSSYYWSSSTDAYDTIYAWSVHFSYGDDNAYGKSHSYYVRAVRGGQNWLLGHLIINGDGTVTDTNTGLMWRQSTTGPVNWQSALAECEGLTMGGYGDWRLPNRRELKSIVDYTVYDPAVNEVYFPNTVSSYYWSSSTYADRTSYAWRVNFYYGYDGAYYKSSRIYVRAVRGGQNWLLGHLIISAPSQGSVWKGGDIMPIRWDTSGIGGNVAISISRQGGKAGTFQTIIGSTTNDGVYYWPVAGEQSVNCVLKLEPANDPTLGTTQGLFSIEAGGDICKPDITANDSDGPIVVSSSTPVSIDISLAPGDKAGQTADWWIAVSTPFAPPGDWYTFVYPALNWLPGVNLCAQTGLFDLTPYEVLNMTLPVGTYTFYFALDDPDWAATGPWWVLDSVEVNVVPPTYTNSLGQTFNLLPAGTFTMGSPSGEPGSWVDERPQHEVTLTQSFYMQTTEVTQAQWEAVMGSNPSYFDDCPTCPVELVSWNDVQEFIIAMNARGEGTYGLPTEAQWEYAARAGSTTAFYNGAITELNCGYDPNLDVIGWYCYNSGSKTHPVAGKAPNAWGLYDMSGNVWEWCSDWYASDYYSISPTDNPQGPSSGSDRVFRGGSWFHYAQYCRSANRNDTPDRRSYYLGFRLVLSSAHQISGW
jgi:formylglycine-generating enzyme required for sulfatase activity